MGTVEVSQQSWQEGTAVFYISLGLASSIVNLCFQSGALHALKCRNYPASVMYAWIHSWYMVCAQKHEYLHSIMQNIFYCPQILPCPNL